MTVNYLFEYIKWSNIKYTFIFHKVKFQILSVARCIRFKIMFFFSEEEKNTYHLID